MVDYEELGRIAVITIRRPEARNAVNGDVAAGIEAAIDRLESSADAWVGILAGEGPVFSAGADLKAISAGGAGGLSTERGGFGGITRRERTKPLIVASRSAAFGLPEVKRSLVAAAGGLFRLPRALPPKVAMEVVLTGEPITAERAHSLGMVNELVEPGQAVEAAKRVAERICANAPLAVQESRKVVSLADTADDDTLWRMSGEAMGRLARTEDFREGPRAFIEKRAPAWQGR